MEGTPKTIRTPTGDPGQDTDEILRSVGYSDAQLAALRSQGVI
jgi:crotonobetainyl-CoA:carnitine CoA-transferase CaiB-like acyl-CoA transferase